MRVAINGGAGSQRIYLRKSREMINTVAEMSGFRLLQWIGSSEVLHTGDQKPIGALGQAVSFLQVPRT